MNTYFDIETTGLNPQTDKILTIQFQQLDAFTYQPIGKIVILKEWELGEKQLLEEFIKYSGVLKGGFAFVPVGYNLGFEHNFILAACKRHGLPEVDVLSCPHLDLKPCGVLMNGGRFKGCGLDKLTRKEHDGAYVPDMYAKKDYTAIMDYITQETMAFNEFLLFLLKHMPKLLIEFHKEIGLIEKMETRLDFSGFK